jgi:mycofactocin system glycosyltransferase
MTLPRGFTVRLADSAWSDRTGEVLIGGSPLTAVRLAPRARALIAGRRFSVTDDASAHLARRLLATDLASPVVSSGARPDVGELTVVIPVHDRPRQLDRTLRTLGDLRCIVVDDASRDPRATAAVCSRHGATLIRLDHNVGPAAARNRGLARVDTRLVALVDSDVEVTSDDLMRLASHFGDPDVVLVGPRIVGRSGTTPPRWFERYDTVATALAVGESSGRVRPGARVGWLPGACLVARTEALGDGFDPDLRVGEDVDLVWRLVATGHTVRYDATVTAHHECRSTARGWLRRLFIYGTGAAPLAARHGGAVAPAVLDPVLAIAGAALLLRRRWSPLVAAAGVAWVTARVRAALPEVGDRDAMAARIAARGLGWAVRQESTLLVRHWWPAAAVAAAFDRNTRRALATALVVDSSVALVQTEGLSAPITVAGRRLTDLAYGAGVWWGCWGQRSMRALLPRGPRSSPGRRRRPPS